MPKLHLNNHMFQHSHRLAFLAVILGIILLGAQLHFCADQGLPSSSHPCPLCSTAASVVPNPLPSIAVGHVVDRLEVIPVFVFASKSFPLLIAPRGPPAV